MRRKLLAKLKHFKYHHLGLPRIDVQPTDCFLTSWPRSGNTWMRYLVAQALWPEDSWDLPRLDQAMSAISRSNIKQLMAQMDPQRPRIFKSHDAFRPYVLKGRTVCIIRNGRDALLSMYHYRKQMDKLDIPLSEFLQRSLQGQYLWGPWHTHVQEWHQQRDHPHVLIIRYEDIRADTAGVLDRVLTFFGHPREKAVIDAAVAHSTVNKVTEGFRKYAANRDHQFESGRITAKPAQRDEFSPEDEALFQKVCGPVMHELGYQ